MAAMVAHAPDPPYPTTTISASASHFACSHEVPATSSAAARLLARPIEALPKGSGTHSPNKSPSANRYFHMASLLRSGTVAMTTHGQLVSMRPGPPLSTAAQGMGAWRVAHEPGNGLSGKEGGSGSRQGHPVEPRQSRLRHQGQRANATPDGCRAVFVARLQAAGILQPGLCEAGGIRVAPSRLPSATRAHPSGQNGRRAAQGTALLLPRLCAKARADNKGPVAAASANTPPCRFRRPAPVTPCMRRRARRPRPPALPDGARCARRT